MPNAFFRWLLESKITNPVIGFFIRFLGSLGWMGPILFMSQFYINSNPVKDHKVCLLALMPERFRGDLEALESAGCGVLRLYSPWMYRIVYSFFRTSANFDAVFSNQNDPDLKVHHERLNRFMQRFLPRMAARLGIDAVIAAAVHYGVAYLWGSNAQSSGTPFIVMHRECLHANSFLREFWTDKWSRVPKYKMSGLIVHNETSKNTFIEGGIASVERSFATGALRMDNYVARALESRGDFPDDPQVTFFSFTHASGQGMTCPHWSKEKGQSGFAGNFDESHGAFAKFAAQNPHVRCVVKVKWLHHWEARVWEAAELVGIHLDELPNFRITADENAHELIYNSSAVCAFGSTTLLEAALAGRPVIVPLLGEAAKPEYQPRILLNEDTKHMVTAHSQSEFIEKISLALANPSAFAMPRETSIQLFEKWIAPTDGTALARTCQAIDTLRVSTCA